MKIPKDILATLRAGLEAREEHFFEMQEAYDDYSEEDVAAFEEDQSKANAWLDAQEDSE